jgi:hypothetical protein
MKLGTWKKNGKHLFLVLMPILVISIIIGLKQFPNKNQACDDEAIFTVSPIEIEKLSSIIPLGALSPSSHIFPTDHIYFRIKKIEGADRTEPVTLCSPGDLFIINIRATEQVKAGITDYALFLEPPTCPDISVMFIHASSLEEALFGDISSYSEWSKDSEYTTGDETYRTWSKSCRIKVKAGEVLGTAGGNPGQEALDLGVYNTHHLPEQIANPERWSGLRYLHTVCPLSYYEEGTVRDALWELVEVNNKERIDVTCGSVLQDIPGTAQGCWFLEGVDETYPEDPHLALVHSNVRPNELVLSVGKSIMNLQSRRYEFTPTDSGLSNRAFSEITPDGKTYGFHVDGFEGLIIIKMPNSNALWIEALESSTQDSLTWKFSTNKTVFVR